MSDEINDDNVTKHDHPVDRLTDLCDEMRGPLLRPENDDVKAIVFLRDRERGGIVMHAYDDETEAMAELFYHIKAVFNSIGKDIDFIGIPDSPEGLTPE
jgi:hypothetical protein